VEEKSAKKETDEGAQCTDEIASPTELNEMPEKKIWGLMLFQRNSIGRRQFNGRHSPEEMEVGQQWMKEGLLRSLSKQM